jgi:hypothetical protein
VFYHGKEQLPEKLLKNMPMLRTGSGADGTKPCSKGKIDAD